MFRFLPLLMTVLATLLMTLGAGAECQPWNWLGPWPQGNDLDAVTRVDDAFLAVGDQGAVLRWDLGDEPSVQYLGGTHLRALVARGELAIAVGAEGRVLRSEDGGLSWSDGQLESDGDGFWAIVDGPEGFVALGEHGLVARSSDGLQWDLGRIENGITVLAATRSGSSIYAVGGSHVVRSDDDGRSWDLVGGGVPGGLLEIATLDDGSLIASGYFGTLVTSADGAKWFSIPLPTLSHLGGIAVQGQQIWVAGWGTLFHSADGARSFELVFAGDNPDHFLRDVAVAPGGEILVVGALGAVVGGDGEITDLRRGSVEWINAIKDGGARMLLTSNAEGIEPGSLWSLDGGDWSRLMQTDEGLRDVVLDGERLVAIGDRGTLVLDLGEGLEERRTDLSRNRGLAAITASSLGLVAVGSDGLAARSADGLSWDEGSTGASKQMRDVIAVPGGFVAIGNDGVIARSVDGLVYERLASPTSRALLGLTSGLGRLVAVGGSGAVVISDDDGYSWRALPSPSTQTLRDVAFTSAGFLAVGDLGTVLRSSDGEVWEPMSVPTRRDLYAVARRGSELLIGGEWGALLSAECFLHPGETPGLVGLGIAH